jgi:hypothetical protein
MDPEPAIGVGAVGLCVTELHFVAPHVRCFVLALEQTACGEMKLTALVSVMSVRTDRQMIMCIWGLVARRQHSGEALSLP